MQVPKLRHWREMRALTQEELAEKAGIGVRSVAGYEAGAGARPGSVRKLAAALEVDVQALLEESESPKAQGPSGSPSPETETTRAGLAAAIEKLKGLPDDQLRQIVDAGSREGMPYLPEGVSRRAASDFAVSKLRELRLTFGEMFEALPRANPDLAAEFEDWKEERRQTLERVNLKRAFADEETA